jgi:hypothetical protein
MENPVKSNRENGINSTSYNCKHSLVAGKSRPVNFSINPKPRNFLAGYEESCGMV